MRSATRFLPAVGWMALLAVVATRAEIAAEQPWQPPRCEVIPLADQRVSFQIAGVEKACWHFGNQYPRPFFFPFNGPAGASLTRMGHPGAQNHDHHRSIWFAHHSVNGTEYWSENTSARIRQTSWYAYSDGDTEAIMATRLVWLDSEGREAMQQQLVAALLPMAENEHALELQLAFSPADKAKPAVLGKTNFGVLAVRMAKSISAHFGGGQITNSEAASGERQIFGKQARWMDYSGPLVAGKGPERKVVTEGITYFDHPHNPRYPTHWHVREDGWMGASFCMQAPYTISTEEPLVLRYLLHAHRGAYNAARAAEVHTAFAERPPFRIAKATRSNRQYEVFREQKP